MRFPVQDGDVSVKIDTCVDADNGLAFIRVAGEIDIATAPLLQDAILAEIRSHRNAIVDVKEVSFMDASGVEALIRAERTSRQCGVRLTVTHPTRLVARVLHLTNADQVLNIRSG